MGNTNSEEGLGAGTKFLLSKDVLAQQQRNKQELDFQKDLLKVALEAGSRSRERDDTGTYYLKRLVLPNTECEFSYGGVKFSTEYEHEQRTINVMEYKKYTVTGTGTCTINTSWEKRSEVTFYKMDTLPTDITDYFQSYNVGTATIELTPKEIEVAIVGAKKGAVDSFRLPDYFKQYVATVGEDRKKPPQSTKDLIDFEWEDDDDEICPNGYKICTECNGTGKSAVEGDACELCVVNNNTNHPGFVRGR